MSAVSNLVRRFTGGHRNTSRGTSSPSSGGGGIGKIVGRLTGRGRRR